MTALRQRLLEVFAVEYREHSEAIRRTVSSAADSGDTGKSGFTEATRCAHSLKGAARPVGLENGEPGRDRRLQRHSGRVEGRAVPRAEGPALTDVEALVLGDSVAAGLGGPALPDPTDVDVYSFRGTAGTEVWLDIDLTSYTLDTIVELLDANGRFALSVEPDNRVLQDRMAEVAQLFIAPGSLRPRASMPARERATSSAMPPPIRLGGMRPRTRFASVIVGSFPPSG